MSPSDPSTVPSTTPAEGPHIGIAGTHDAADRACTVILRQGLPIEANGWQATIEVSATAAADGEVPALLWQRPGQGWQSTPAVLANDGLATPGYLRYTVTLDVVHQPIAAIPYLPLAGGGRLFDHNRNPADTANYAVAAPDFAVWTAPTTCAAPTSAAIATVAFAADYTQTQAGPIVAGGQLQLDYATSRLTQCAHHAAPHLTAHVRFEPSGIELAPSIDSGAASVVVPTDAAGHVAVWFEASSSDGCRAYDSAYGANYTFAVAPPPRWLGLAQNLLTRDPSSPCGGADAASPFSFDTLVRQQDSVTNLCFQAYQPGITDNAGADLQQNLAATVTWRLVGATQQTAWTVSPAILSPRAGNNARYQWSLRDVDPFRDLHCPEVSPLPTGDGHIQLGLEYVISVNGLELRPAPEQPFTGSFVDNPTTPWRTANCH